MILKDVAVNKRFLKHAQLFWLAVEFEDDKGNIKRCIIDLEKGLKAKQVAEKTESLAQQIREV
jgi:hypothetical protein